jgi:hypothetical protein
MLVPLRPRVRRLLRFTDSIVCILLLFELGFRLCLVRGRVRYFLRHFLTDFLPSIPFLAYARSVRAFRLARLGRFARMFRVVVLAFRGIDRLTARLSRLLHWNVLFFEPYRRSGPPPGQGATDERTALASRVMERLRLVVSELTSEERRRVARVVGDHLEGSLAALTLEREWKEEVGVREPGAVPETRGLLDFDRREIRFEEVVTVLLRLTPEEVRERLGPALCKRIHRLVRLLDTPVVRHLPLIAAFARSHRDEPAATTAQAGRALGRLLAFWLASVNWFADLHGVVTGPQLVDRIGTGIAAASRRPAVRLLLLGVLFLVTKAVVDLLELHSSVLSAIIDFLGRSLGLAIVVLGAACLLVHALGLWLRRIAGEATDVYEKTAEAQFINLLEGEKARQLEIDRALLERRVLDREPELRSLPDPWKRSAGSAGARDLVEIVRLLHLDSLDGALLHRSDLKTTEQLLGNLTLESIRTSRLRLGKKELKRTRRLDLSRERAFFGPYFWFNSLFTSLQQKTAKLLLDYNRSCVPRRDLGHVSDRVRERHEAFLARRGEADRGRAKGRKERDRDRRAVRGFVTTFFHALHFLSADPERDEVVRERFGDAVLARLREDRRSLIRRTFGTYPFHARPREARTVNAHDLYRRYVRGGRVVLMPLWILLLWLRLAGWMGGRLLRTIVDLLDPRDVIRAPLLAAEASFGVARRKIDRMRKPVFMECLRLRARFDPEYLGVATPGSEPEGAEAGTVEADLFFIGASPAEEQEIASLKDGVREASVHFERYLARSGLADGAAFDRFLARGDSELPRYREEALRAMHIAFVIDWRGVQALLAGESSDERQRGEKILMRAAREHHSFSRQLVTVRAVQTLSLIDVKNDLRMVHALGGYAGEGEPWTEL